jgi:retron-type reverse transcriptase
MPVQERVRSLQIAFFNANGLRGSRNELETFADDHDLDLILVGETKLQAGVADPKIRGFVLYRSDRDRGPGGGTAIYVRNATPHYQITLPVLQSLEATAVRVETANGPLTIISCYHPPRILLRENDITEILDTGTSVIAAGDFNAKHQAWGSRVANRNGRILYELADAIDLLVEAPPEPTYYSPLGHRADTLDIALLKNVPLQTRLHVVNALDSDHLPVLMHIGDEANDENLNTQVQITNWPLFAEILETDFGPIPRIESVEDLENAAGVFEEKITTAMTNSTRNRVEPRQKETLPQWIIDLIRTKNRARRHAFRTGAAVDRTEANRLGNEVKYALIDHRNDRWERKLESLSTEDNSIWRMAKALRSDKKPIPPIHSTLGLVFSDDEKAEAFADSLELQCRPNIVDADLDHIERIERQVEIILSGQHDTPNTPASPEEVRGIIGTLKVKKAPGPDKIPNTALKLLPDKAVVALTAIINASLRFCHFPSRWKSANVIFIPKPGKDLLFPQNYRPISLLSNVGKVLEKVILTRLVRATNENHVLPDEQFGFRPKHSTADQLIHVTEFISQGINQNESTGAIFLDVAKAFDTVWHDGLVYKLHTAGVSLAMVKLLNSFLEDRKFHAKIGNVLSTVREIEAGVPQGSVLSPTLYAIFTADIPKPDETKIALYADDTAILTRSESPELISEQLRRAVESLEAWFRRWRIDVNPDKSSAILFTRRRHRPDGEIVMFDRPIPWKTEARYLGITFDNHLRFNAQLEHAKIRAQMVLGQLNSLVNRRSKMSIQNKVTIYRTIVRPAMMYGSAVWGNVCNTQLHKLQVVQNKFLRAAFKAPWFVRNTQLHREAKLPTIREFLHDVARKFFENAAVHPNPLVRDSVDYDENAPQRHKRPKCLLLRQD